MAAERCRAELSIADITLSWSRLTWLGVAPCRTMAAEDIRDLQRRTGQGGRRYAGGRTFLLWPGFWRACDSRSSGLAMLAIMPVATRV